MNAKVARWFFALFGLGKTRTEGKQIHAITKRRVLAPRFSISISGFRTFGSGQSEAEEARRGLESLNGRITLPKVDPADPQSAQQAIRQMELDIDAKVGPYSQNRIVADAARKLKNDFREMVLKQLKSAARSTTEKK